jgi:hypothetical protein
MHSSNLRTSQIAWLILSASCLYGQVGKVGADPKLTARSNMPVSKSIPPETAVVASIPKLATLAAGLPLRVQLDHRYRMRKGSPVRGKLLDPVYAGDHVVIPANSILYGRISRLEPLKRNDRTWALLDGDVTPLKDPLLTFDTLQLPSGQRLQLTADATERTAGVVKMGGPAKKQSLFRKLAAQAHAKVQGFKDAFHSKHKSDKALQMLYGQLPYHPLEIWAGTQFDALLASPLTVPDPKAADKFPIDPPHGHIPTGTLEARLITPLSSRVDKVGTPVEAVLTQPYFDKNHTHVILPTGTQLVGVVTQAKPARGLGRNGTLRFTFRQIQLPQGTMQKIHAQMTAVEGRKGQNITLDSEGGAHANADKGKYLDPLVLGALAGNSLDADQNFVHAGVSSNGFGLLGNVVALAAVSPEITAGFAYYAVSKSITRRWLLRGHEVEFAKNTRMQLAVADR